MTLSRDSASVQPLLLVDVDGVLAPFGAGRYPDHYEPVPGREIHLAKIHAEWLIELSTLFEVVWATTWEHDANAIIGSALGVPAFPVIEFRNGRAGETWKLEDVKGYVGERPLAWIDDELWADAEEWAATRGVPTLLIKTSSRVGFTAEHVSRLKVFAERLAMAEPRVYYHGDLPNTTVHFEFAPYGDLPPEESVYVLMEDFDLLQPIFDRHCPEFDYTGITVVPRDEWAPILTELENVDDDPPGLQGMGQELSKWIKLKLETHAVLCINGV